jgi:DNA-binding GntR family transcriptional regulator
MTSPVPAELTPLALPPRRSLAEQAVEVLRELVLTGQLAAGTRLNEVEVAQRLGISRGPLREAIQHLISEGLLVHVPHRGAHVPAADPAGVAALFELRTALESAAARLAATRRGAGDVAALRAITAESRQRFEAGERFPYRLDLAFHHGLLAAADSPRIAAAVRLVQQQVILLRSGIAGLAADTAHGEASLADHDALVAAVEAGDGDRAAAVMAGHLDRVRDQLLTALAAR